MNAKISLFMLTLLVSLHLSMFGPPASSTTPEFRITSPRANSVVPSEVIEVSGAGADPTGTIEIEVLTNNWYRQNGEARINADGTWSFSPVHLEGQGTYNNHTLRATIVKGGRRIKSVTVGGIVRKQ